jgi:hypothetical protein
LHGGAADAAPPISWYLSYRTAAAAFVQPACLELPLLDPQVARELTFLDSCGVHAILEFARAQNGNGPVVILDPSDAVTRVLEIIGIDQHAGMELRRSTAPPLVA